MKECKTVLTQVPGMRTCDVIEDRMDARPQEFKILVADDSPVYRKLVERALCAERFDVLFAKSGQQAIELFDKHQPALVVTDWMMPGITGIELCAAHTRKTSEQLHIHHHAHQHDG